MSTLRVFAVDDEELALQRIQLLVSRVAGAEMVGTARGAQEALGKIRAARPDVVLVDVNMPGSNGFELVNSLPSSPPPMVIFVTAFENYAAAAFQVNAVDYLVKPVELPRLKMSLEKVRRSVAAADAEMRVAELRQVVSALRQQAQSLALPRFETEIWAEKQGEFFPIRVADIERVEAERDYVHLHTGARSFILRETISNMTERLDPDQFIRVRRSTLVRRDRVRAVRRAGYGKLMVQLENGYEVRVGTTFVKQIRELVFQRGPTSQA